MTAFDFGFWLGVMLYYIVRAMLLCGLGVFVFVAVNIAADVVWRALYRWSH